MRYKKIKNLSDNSFRRRTGVKRETFRRMLSVLRIHEMNRKSKAGRPSKLPIEDQLLMALEYWREYRTYFHIGTSYGVSESTCYAIVINIENIFIKNEIFHVPGKKELIKPDAEFLTVLIDATETPCERPKKKQKKNYSGKKKRHTLKAQIVVDKLKRGIICIYIENGTCHDYKIGSVP
jgi:hypothetical protein